MIVVDADGLFSGMFKKTFQETLLIPVHAFERVNQHPHFRAEDRVDGDANPQSPLQGAFRDEGGAPHEVDGEGAEVRKGKGRGGGNDNGEGRDDRERRDFGGTIRDVG